MVGTVSKSLSQLMRVMAVAGKSENTIRYLSCVVKYVAVVKLLKRASKLRLREDLVLDVCPGSASSGQAVLSDLLYEPRLMCFVDREFSEQDTCIDVGANIGIYSLLAARRASGGKVISVEANPDVFSRLCRNIRANKHENIIPVNCAAAGAVGTIRFSINDGDCQGCIDQEGSGNNHIEIPCRTLDSFIEELGEKSPDFVKLDVEGAEHAVLDGSAQILENGETVFLVDHYFKSLADRFLSCGYLPYRYDALSRTLTPVSRTAEQEHGSIFIHPKTRRFSGLMVESNVVH
jgi:FkbM family methyltransferase